LATSGKTLTRRNLSAEAIRLARLLMALLPDWQLDPEVTGLLTLMLLNESRRRARTAPDGDASLLEAQDRSLSQRAFIDEGVVLTRQALSSGRILAHALQTAISATHAEVPSTAGTDWREIVGLYDLLLKLEPSPVVALNRAVAVAMCDGPATGLALADALRARGELKDYRLAHAARADFCRRLQRDAKARAAYQWALQLTHSAPKRAISSDSRRRCKHNSRRCQIGVTRFDQGMNRAVARGGELSLLHDKISLIPDPSPGGRRVGD